MRKRPVPLLNANKFGITLNLKQKKGAEIFKRLIETATYSSKIPAGYMAGLGLGYDTLKKSIRDW